MPPPKHECTKGDLLLDIQKEQDKINKAIYGNGQPGILKEIATQSGQIGVISEIVTEIRPQIKDIVDFVVAEKALKKEGENSKGNKWQSLQTWGLYLGLLASILFSLLKGSGNKVELITDVQMLREAMREEKNITIRGPSITKENTDAYNKEIKDMNK
jgi:hypothetical protein